MKTHLRSRTNPAWRYALPAVTVAAAMTAALVPSQVAAQTHAPAATASESAEDPTAPGPGRLEEEPQALIIAQEADQAFRYSLTLAMASDATQAFPAGSIEAILQAGALSLPAERQERARISARALLADERARVAEFGRYGRMSPAEYTRLGFDGAFTDLPVDGPALKRSLEAQAAQVEAEAAVTTQHALDVAKAEGIDPTASTSLLKGLSMRVASVKAHDTNEYFGDEIRMGGVAVDHKGVTKKIAPFAVKNDFDAGEVKVYQPALTFSYDNLVGSDPAAPKTDCDVVLLADADLGGFADAVSAAWAEVKGKVLAAIEGIIGTALSVYLGKVLAGLLGKVIGWLVDKLLGWLIKLAMDDVFSPAKTCMTIPHRYGHMFDNNKIAGWDNMRTSNKSLWFSDKWSLYEAKIYWQAHV